MVNDNKLLEIPKIRNAGNWSLRIFPKTESETKLSPYVITGYRFERSK